MIDWIKKLLRIVREFDSRLANSERQLLARIREAEAFIRERTDVSVDAAFSSRDVNSVIVLGRYRGVDYVQTFQLPGGDFDHVVQMLKEMSRYHKVRYIDAPQPMSAVIKRDLFRF